MTPLYLYITRPYAYEIYMGGKRDLRVWVEQPYYSHQSRSYDGIGGRQQYVDLGWRSHFDSGQRAKELLGQDEELLSAVWKEVYISVLPKGLTYEEGPAWEMTPIISNWQQEDVAWHYLFEDKEWEAKCNTCYKRFLLKVDVRTNTVERIKPNVIYRRLHEDDPPAEHWVSTDECPAYFATEYFHPDPGPDDIPFE